MTPQPTELPPLRTDADVLERVRTLIGEAITHRQLWIVFVDGDDVQLPVVMPVGEMPAEPPAEMFGLAEVLAGLREDMATEQGPGSVVLVWERRGSGVATRADRAWARSLAEACRTADVVMRGVFLASSDGVGPLTASGG